MNMAGKTSIRKANKKGVVREYAEAFIIAFIIALLIRTFLVQAFKIPSSSMEPTLLVGDHILVSKFIYGLRIPYIGKKFLTFHKPNRGDVVVFVYPEDPKKDFIKRVIATGGEEVQIKNRKIFINGMAIEDPWGVLQPLHPEPFPAEGQLWTYSCAPPLPFCPWRQPR
jgi:signal peptidase I